MQYAKVAEYQLRGAIHFHALVRLDGPRTHDGFAPAPDAIDADTLAQLVQQAVAAVHLLVPGVDAADPARVLVFGRQLDVRPVRTSRRTDDPDHTLTPGQVAGYLAKYATKSADDDTGTNNRAPSPPPRTPSPTSPPEPNAVPGATPPLENPYDAVG